MAGFRGKVDGNYSNSNWFSRLALFLFLFLGLGCVEKCTLQGTITYPTNREKEKGHVSSPESSDLSFVKKHLDMVLYIIWVVVSNIFLMSMATSIFQTGWNHQLVIHWKSNTFNRNSWNMPPIFVRIKLDAKSRSNCNYIRQVIQSDLFIP